ncbi:ATP-binding protein [uncultured Shewanella sp.]|uniref:ATP-binding protein n=1 Tax=Shewanella atlantica TaxID=271099 RepID=UPI00261634DE|nr:ATP-binding protein [uncultured Shewanella sp.]
MNSRLAIIMRGLPGSGKSRWVDEFISAQPREVADLIRRSGHFSTDSQFYRSGEYCFDNTRLSEYHQRNLTCFIQALSASVPIVICDNTNLARWESMAYEAAAKALGYRVRYVLIGEPRDEEHQLLCAARNSHGVPLEQIKRMAGLFEPF